MAAAIALLPLIPVAGAALEQIFKWAKGDSPSDKGKLLAESKERLKTERRRFYVDSDEDEDDDFDQKMEKLQKKQKKKIERLQAELKENVEKQRKELAEQNQKAIQQLDEKHARQLQEMKENGEKHMRELAEQNQRLYKQLAQYQEQNAQQCQEMKELIADAEKKKLKTFEDIQKYDAQKAAAIIRLAKAADEFKLVGNNVGLFGLTSCGKSTMLNALYGRKVAKVGHGETTVELKSYKTKNYTLWDIPGNNNEVSYLTLEYISLFKGLSHRLIIVVPSLKENSGIMKLLDAIGLDYDVAVNKMDQCPEDKRAAFREQIKGEKRTLGLKNLKRMFFVSAEYPGLVGEQFTEMVDHLTNPRE